MKCSFGVWCAHLINYNSPFALCPRLLQGVCSCFLCGEGGGVGCSREKKKEWTREKKGGGILIFPPCFHLLFLLLPYFCRLLEEEIFQT